MKQALLIVPVISWVSGCKGGHMVSTCIHFKEHKYAAENLNHKLPHCHVVTAIHVCSRMDDTILDLIQILGLDQLPAMHVLVRFRNLQQSFTHWYRDERPCVLHKNFESSHHSSVIRA